MAFVVMVAGPNGSGKTTLTDYLRAQGVDLGLYINADEIAAGLRGAYEKRVVAAQAIADKEREDALAAGADFTFETVMSHPSKLDFFERCRMAGYEAVLYFVATRDPLLNVERVRQRVRLGGHDVPEDRIVQRYARSLVLLPRALKIATRAAVFDNSDENGLALGLRKRTAQRRSQFYQPSRTPPEWIATALKAALALG